MTRTSSTKALLLQLAIGVFVAHSSGNTLYVDVNSTNSALPYPDWSTAATNIQDAVDASSNGDLILVNDGVYENGFGTNRSVSGTTSSIQTNRVLVGKPVVILSVNGPARTIISGGGKYRCVFLTNGAVLSGFTVRNGSAGWYYTNSLLPVGTIDSDGGGIAGTPPIPYSAAVVSNCIIVENSATHYGGGAFQTKLVNCTLSDNRADDGGGAADSILLNCTITHNVAAGPNTGLGDGFSSTGGGTFGSTAINCLIANNTAQYGGGAGGAAFGETVGLINCTVVSNYAAYEGGVTLPTLARFNTGYATNSIIYFNSAQTNANYAPGSISVSWSCTSPMASGQGNITNSPIFADAANGDFRSAFNSPVINSGNNSSVQYSTDVDGNPRIAGGTVDIGAYEFPSPASSLSYVWAQQYGLPTDGTADGADPGTAMA